VFRLPARLLDPPTFPTIGKRTRDIRIKKLFVETDKFEKILLE